MKDELINAIQPDCLLPFQQMSLWLDSVVLINDPTGGVRQQIKAQLRSNGNLTQAGWILLINNVVFDDLPPINKATALNWINTSGRPSCSQLKIFINTFKVGTMEYFKVLYPVLDLAELNIKTGYENDYNQKVWNKRISQVTGAGESLKLNIMLMQLYVGNYDLIKDCNPYLVLERYLPKKKKSNTFYQDPTNEENFIAITKSRKSGWKRDRTLNRLGATFYDGWSQNNVLITESNFYRPNFIPITAKTVTLDIFAENYVRNNLGNKDIKSVSGNTNTPKGGGRYNVKVPMRARIGAMIGGKEIFSKPLIYFSIFAKVMERDATFNEKEVQIQFSKL